jgi:hypothetical protein
VQIVGHAARLPDHLAQGQLHVHLNSKGSNANLMITIFGDFDHFSPKLLSIF